MKVNKKIVQNLYFVNEGNEKGQFLVIVDYDKKTKSFSTLAIPDTKVLYITENDISKAIKHKVLEIVEKLPKDVFKDCVAEFKYRESTLKN